MSDLIKDAKAAYAAWEAAPRNSYLEGVLGQAIIRDFIPSLIHAAERGKTGAGFKPEVHPKETPIPGVPQVENVHELFVIDNE